MMLQSLYQCAVTLHLSQFYKKRFIAKFFACGIHDVKKKTKHSPHWDSVLLFSLYDITCNRTDSVHHVRYHAYLSDNTIRSEYPGGLLAIVYYSVTLSETHRFTGST